MPHGDTGASVAQQGTYGWARKKEGELPWRTLQGLGPPTWSISWFPPCHSQLPDADQACSTWAFGVHHRFMLYQLILFSFFKCAAYWHSNSKKNVILRYVNHSEIRVSNRKGVLSFEARVNILPVSLVKKWKCQSIIICFQISKYLTLYRQSVSEELDFHMLFSPTRLHYSATEEFSHFRINPSSFKKNNTLSLTRKRF